jgi:hypothetical protein
MSEGLRLVVTSVVRRAGQQEASGFVRVVDWDQKRVLMKSAVPEGLHRAKDPNPRGGLRGARGVATCGARLIIANTERLWVLDARWQLVGEITHPWMGGIHDILAEESGIWITCASADLLLKTDWTGTIVCDWEWRRDKGLTAALGFRTLSPVDRELDYRNPETGRNTVGDIVHLNGVAHGADGLLLSFGRILPFRIYKKQRLLRVLGRLAVTLSVRRRLTLQPLLSRPVKKIGGSSWAAVLLGKNERTQVLKRSAGINVPNHNLVQVEDSLIYNDSNTSQIVQTSLDPSIADRRVLIPGQPSFIRGLAQLDRENFLVGNQAPLALYQVNLVTHRVVSSLLLDGEPNESVYGICLIPPEFNSPPASLTIH